MTSLLRPLMRSLRSLFLGLTVLCLLAQPVLAAAHELHEARHALAEALVGDHGVPMEADAPHSSFFDGLVHGFDCSLHVTAMPIPVLSWTPHRLQSEPRWGLNAPVHIPSPSSRLLRPPIVA